MVYLKEIREELDSIREQLGDEKFIVEVMDYLNDDMALRLIEDVKDSYDIKPKVKK